MLLFPLDRKSRTPVYRQIIDSIIHLIEVHSLEPGEHLPSTRTLSESLGVNRSTVYRAYQELYYLGYVASRPGSNTIVRDRAGLASQDHRMHGAIPWAERANKPSALVHLIFTGKQSELDTEGNPCLLYTSDAADE